MQDPEFGRTSAEPGSLISRASGDALGFPKVSGFFPGRN